MPKIELVETKIGDLLLFQNEDFISQALCKNGRWAELESSFAVLNAKKTDPLFKIKRCDTGFAYLTAHLDKFKSRIIYKLLKNY